MIVVNGGHAQEHEDDRLRGGAQHLQGVLQRRLRLGRDVALDIILHCDATECDPGKKRIETSMKMKFELGKEIMILCSYLGTLIHLERIFSLL